MGNSPSYAKLAAVSWYREGSKLYGASGFEKHMKSRRFDDLPSCVRADDQGRRLLEGRVVLITGANSGIGKAAAQQCAELGAEVHLLCRNVERGNEAVADIRRQITRPAEMAVHQLDVSDIDAVRAFVNTTVEQHIVGPRDDVGKPRRPIHVLINNAGCMPQERQQTAQGHEAIVATTLGGTALLSVLLLPYLAEDGRVVNVSSGGQYTVPPRTRGLDLTELTGKKYDGTLIYAFAKRWQVQLTHWLAERYAAHPRYGRIGFYSLHPGWAVTDGVRVAMKDFVEKQERNGNPFRTAAQGADTVTFLAAATPAMLALAAAAAKKGSYDRDEDEKADIAKEALEAAKTRAIESGTFWFDREPVHPDKGYGTAYSDKQRDELAAAVAEYVGLSSLAPS